MTKKLSIRQFGFESAGTKVRTDVCEVDSKSN